MIGAIGMLLCWIATFLLLPALILRFSRTPRVRDRDHLLGSVLVFLFGFRRSKLVVAVVGVIAIAASVLVVRYVIADPFEYDIRALRSEGDAARDDRYWMKVSDDAFGRGFAGRTFIAADRLATRCARSSPRS